MRGLVRNAAMFVLLAVVLLATAAQAVAETTSDVLLLIRNAMVFDGTGRAAYGASVLVERAGLWP